MLLGGNDTTGRITGRTALYWAEDLGARLMNVLGAWRSGRDMICLGGLRQGTEVMAGGIMDARLAPA